jgi:hypothetical protein
MASRAADGDAFDALLVMGSAGYSRISAVAWRERLPGKRAGEGHYARVGQAKGSRQPHLWKIKVETEKKNVMSGDEGRKMGRGEKR